MVKSILDYYPSDAKKYVLEYGQSVEQGVLKLLTDGYMSVSNRYQHIARPDGDFSKYGYEWHARMSHDVIELSGAVLWRALKKLSARNPRCSYCGVLNGHKKGCRTVGWNMEQENRQLKSQLNDAMLEIKELRNGK